MCVGLGWAWETSQQYTLRQLTVQYDTQLLNTWDHTAATNTLIANVIVMVDHVRSMFNRRHRALPAASFADHHPFREAQKKSKGLRFSPENFGALKRLFGRLRRG